MTTNNRNLVYAVLFLVGGFIFGTVIWAKMYPSDYNAWVRESGFPLPAVWEPTVEVQPTVIVATAYPRPTSTQQSTATVVPTPINTPVPTPMRCSPDDVGDWTDRDELEKLEAAEQASWLESGRTYSIFLIVDTDEQICVAVGDWDVQLIENSVNHQGLSESASVAHQFEYQSGFTGKPAIVWTDYREVERIIIETPKVTGPNDGLVRSIWPNQMSRINEAGTWLFKSPIFDETLDYSEYSPASLCNWMGDWERIAPLPEEVAFCHSNWHYEIDSFLGNGYWLSETTSENGLMLKVFWIKPETVYLSESDEYPSEPVKFEDAGPLKVGLKLSKDTEVLGTCETPDKYDLESSRFRDSVVIRLSGFGYDLVMPKSSYIGVGTVEGAGWEKLYRVCP